MQVMDVMENLSASHSFDYLDRIEFKRIFLNQENASKMKFYIEGMRCSKCVHRIESLVDHEPRLKSLTVDLGSHTAVVETDGLSSIFGEVASRIEKLGFKVIPIPWKNDGQDQWKNESRDALLRLGIAGFLAANIMMLALATYFGDVGPLKSYFLWLQFFLYLPVVGYVAIPFYQGFYAGIKNKSLTIDGPMAVASFAGFLVSFYNLLQGTETIYFDSLSGFLFLILVTRYWQKSVRHKYLQYLRPSALIETFKARKIKNNAANGRAEATWDWIPTKDLKKKDVIQVHRGEWIPVDGKLIDESARFDLSVLNGESYAHKYTKAASVRAGSKLISESARIEVEAIGENTTLGNILANIDAQSMGELDSIKLSDVASQVLLITVFSVAGIILAYGFFQGQFFNYFERAFAVIIVACPCAMAFGTPLVFSFSMKKAQQLGLVIKKISFFERLLKVDTVFLDKTGTLTNGEWSIEDESEVVDYDKEFLKAIILKLEAKSMHPIAMALRNLWQDVNVSNTIEFHDLEEIKGVGVRAWDKDVCWSFKGIEIQGKKMFALFREDKCLWCFRLNAQVLPQAQEIISWLEEHNISCNILSGDTAGETLRVAKAVGISADHCHFNMTPEGKLELLKLYPRALMIGDGYNDVLALKNSFTSIAAHGGVDSALKTADAFFIDSGLLKIKDLFQIAKMARRQVKINLYFALVYNAIGALMAIFGMINPFVAAILMPISSSLILIATWWGMR